MEFPDKAYSAGTAYNLVDSRLRYSYVAMNRRVQPSTTRLPPANGRSSKTR